MRKTDLEINDQSIIDLLERDPIGRSKDLADAFTMLNEIEGNFTIFLDADWGAGKTVFVRQLKMLLEHSNPTMEKRAELAPLTCARGQYAVFGEGSSFLPIYYNAWKNDYWEDPLASLAVTIAAEFNMESSLKLDPEKSDAIVAVVDALLTPLQLGGSASTLREGLSAKNLIEDYEKRKAFRDRVSELADKILEERANTLLLIIDELDRCRPEFAIKLLEEVKSLFSSDKIIILYSGNEEQLAQAARGAYGPGFDGRRYLSKFYDMKVRLTDANHKRYLPYLGVKNTANYFDRIVNEIPGVLNMTLRDANRYVSKTNRVRDDLADGPHRGSVLDSFVRVGLVPVMLAIGISNPDDFTVIAKGGHAELLLTYFEKCPSARSFLDRCCEEVIPLNQEDEPSLEQRTSRMLDLLKALSIVIWEEEPYSERFEEAKRTLGRPWDIEHLVDAAIHYCT